MKNYYLLISIFFIAACSTPTPQKYTAPCITSDYENFTLTWGYDYESNDKIMAYELNGDGKLLFYQQNRQTKEKKIDTLATIEPERLCEMLKQTNDAYVYTPALNEPGKKLGFVELKKPTVRFLSKATWNEFNTYGSKQFRALFDTLLTLVPAKIKK